MVTWRYPFNAVAATQGWLLMTDRQAKRINIRAYPYSHNKEGLYGRFESDEDAEEFVRKQAAAGDETATEAIALLVKQAMGATDEFFSK